MLVTDTVSGVRWSASARQCAGQRQIGVSFQQIQKYENGVNGVRAHRAQQIADALGCKPAWFFAGKPVTSVGKASAVRWIDAELEAFFADKYAAQLVRGFIRLPLRTRRAMANVVAAVARRRTERRSRGK